jgi:hypothetical protein
VYPDLGSGTFLTPGFEIGDPGWEKIKIRIRDPGSGINILDHISDGLETIWAKNT